MNRLKYMGNFALAICIVLVASITGAAELETTTNDTKDQQIKIIQPAIKEIKWQLSVVAGGISKHLSTEYEPTEGYTETHASAGLKISQAKPGWVFSAQAFRFNDSFDKDSFLIVGSFGYRLELNYSFFLYGGAGAGIVDTSYYSGGIVLPIIELGWWRISVQGSYFPKLDDTDEVIAAHLKFKIFEW